MEHVDAFVLDPDSSHELVQRLSTNSTWKITCNAPGLVIFIRSASECIDEPAERNSPRGAGRGIRGGAGCVLTSTHSSPPLAADLYSVES
jgi:hypothetical protein